MLVLLLFCIAAATAKNIGSMDKIVNGEAAIEGEFPYQAALETLSGSHMCGAVVVSNKLVMTAAHCTGSSFRVITGQHLRSKSAGTDTFSVRKVTNHQNYNTPPGFSSNDISLVEVDGTITNVAPIPVAGANMDFAGQTCNISGWGRLSGGGPIPNELRETIGTILTYNECLQYWSSPSLQPEMVCIHNPQTGACNGDSGGPLVCESGGVKVLVGVTSWGASGCSTSRPSVYTRLSSFTPWINSASGGAVTFFSSEISPVLPTAGPSNTAAPTPAPTQPPIVASPSPATPPPPPPPPAGSASEGD